MLGVMAGGGGALDVLRQGLTWVSAGMLAYGAIAGLMLWDDKERIQRSERQDKRG